MNSTRFKYLYQPLIFVEIFLFSYALSSQKLDDKSNHMLLQFLRQISGSLSYADLSGMSDMVAFRDSELSAMLVERVSGSQGNLDVQQHIRQRMDRLGWAVSEHSFTQDTPVGAVNFTNIVATLNPAAQSRIVLACHFDSKLLANFVGATDSAVPCAMMLDLGRTLNDTLWNMNEKEVTLQFIFFDGEEAFESWSASDSLYGSRHLASKLQPTPQQMPLFVLLDLIGHRDPKFRNLFKSTSDDYQQLVDIEKALSRYLYPHESYFEFTQPPSFNSMGDDHEPFLEYGIAVLHLISTPFPRVWHTVDDDAAHLHFPCIENLNLILRVFVLQKLGITVYP